MNKISAVICRHPDFALHPSIIVSSFTNCVNLLDAEVLCTVSISESIALETSSSESIVTRKLV